MLAETQVFLGLTVKYFIVKHIIFFNQLTMSAIKNLKKPYVAYDNDSPA